VGKTTSTYHVGCWLAEYHEQKVLLIDIDPQTNLTFLCAPVEDWEKQKKRVGTIASIYRRFVDKKSLDVKRHIWRTPIALADGRLPRLDLLPCDIDLLGEDIGSGAIQGTFPTMEHLKRQADVYLHDRSFLRRVVREVEDDYDYILVDCPPNLYGMTQNALVVSRWYVVTAIPDHLSTIGLNILIRKVEGMGKLLQAAYTFAASTPPGQIIADLGGIIFVKVRQGGSMIVNVHEATMDQIASQVGEAKCFDHYTTELIGYSEAATNAVPVWHNASPNSRKAAREWQYQAIADEFVGRF
jgi:chromosome partitioning protein